MYRLVLVSVAAYGGRGAEVEPCSMAAGVEQCHDVHEQSTAGVELMQRVSATRVSKATVEDDAAGIPQLVPAARMTAKPVPKPVPELKKGERSSLTQVKGVCADNCWAKSCDFWFHQGYSCLDMENIYGCDCSDCRCEVSATCHDTCHDNTCEFWKTHGYTCDEMENTYGCDCSGCACGPSPEPAPAPEPTPAPAPSPGCEELKPTHHYPLPEQDYLEGLPSPMVPVPDAMSMCDVKQLQVDCVDRINMFRGGHPFSDGRTRDHGQMSDLQGAPTDFAKCMNEKALSDLLYSEHQGQGCGHFSMSLDCGLSVGSGHRAENSCCPRACTSYESCQQKLFQCLDSMWDEGKIVLDTNNLDWTGQTGHYWNMLSTSATTAACGFGFDSEGNMLATQNFY